MDNLTLATCSYNTPLVTETMIRSFFKHHKKTNLLVCENSTNEETLEFLTKHDIPFIKNSKGLHSPSVDLLIENCKTDYMLLVDTDVIFLKSHEPLLKQFIELDLALMGEVCGDRGGKKIYNRVHPWHCFINVKQIKRYGITFFDEKRLVDRTGPKIYDVGSSFFEDVRKYKLKIGNIAVQDIYYKHYEGMSWRTLKYGSNDGNIDVNSEDTHNSIALLKYGKFVERMYEQEIPIYKDVPILIKE